MVGGNEMGVKISYIFEITQGTKVVVMEFLEFG